MNVIQTKVPSVIIFEPTVVKDDRAVYWTLPE